MSLSGAGESKTGREDQVTATQRQKKTANHYTPKAFIFGTSFCLLAVQPPDEVLRRRKEALIPTLKMQ